MATATLNGIPFRLNPISVTCSFKIKTVDYLTKGGRVLQVLGSDYGDLNVDGSFGRGGWEEQQTFLDRMLVLATTQWQHPTGDPSHFVFPERGWNFKVYLTNYASLESASSVLLSDIHPGPTWSLTFMIVEDNGGIFKKASDAYIARLSDGLGWHVNDYNGPGATTLVLTGSEGGVNPQTGVGSVPLPGGGNDVQSGIGGR